jgi:uncharacterized protein YdhG (YjbR/CyaY superfamily)
MFKKITTIDQYIESAPKKSGMIVKKIARMVRVLAPAAAESISYGMPAFKLHGKPLVYMAAWDNHVGLYATPAANTAFKKELQSYKTSKGAIQFPLEKIIPYALIEKIVLFKVGEITRAAAKTCSRGHLFYKSKEIPTCPVCWPGRYIKK